MCHFSKRKGNSNRQSFWNEGDYLKAEGWVNVEAQEKESSKPMTETRVVRRTETVNSGKRWSLEYIILWATLEMNSYTFNVPCTPKNGNEDRNDDG